MLISCVSAAVDLSSGDDISIKLRIAKARKVYAQEFQKLAEKAIEADEETRVNLNDSLLDNFEKMQRTLTPSKLIVLCTIETQEEATQALAYYNRALSQVEEFIELLNKYLIKLL
jgi:hypothetical protein